MSDVLIGDEFANRPDDDKSAFPYYERFFRGPRDEVLSKLQAYNHDNYWEASNHFTQIYINQVTVMVIELNIDLLNYSVNSPAAINDEKSFKQIQYDIDAAIVSIKVRHAQLDRKSSVRLESDTREKNLLSNHWMPPLG